MLVRNLLLKPAFVFSLILGLGLMPPSPAEAAGDDVVVFAAASTTDVVTEAASAFEKKTGFTVTPSFAASGTLARQIGEGAPANIFISANIQWVDYLDSKGLLESGSRLVIASNQLVLVAPKGDEVPDPFKFAQLPNLVDGRRLAIGNPAHVPAGSYAKSAFQSLGIWTHLQSNFVLLPNVRAVLALVERGEVPYGVVYETDARLSKDVKIAERFPKESYPVIAYGMAMVKGNASHAAKLFYDYLKSEEGQAIFHKYGFSGSQP